VLKLFANGAMVGQPILQPLDGNPSLTQVISSPDGARFDTAAISFNNPNLRVILIDDITFTSNTPPVADAGDDQTVAVSGATTPVTLNGSDSSDPDSDPLTYAWSEGGASLGSDAMLHVSLTPGTHAITLVVTDSHGAASTDDMVVNVVYSHTNVLQPVNVDGSSVFKLGRTVPVKFKLTGASAGISDLAAGFSAAYLGASSTGDVNEPEEVAEGSTGSLFRYDAGSDQYIFNWKTKDLAAGLYELRIDLRDGTDFTVEVHLK
jgi:hypothetical protein